MISLLNPNAIIAIAKTLTTAYIITDTPSGYADPFSMLLFTEPDILHESSDPVYEFKWLTENSGYSLLEVSEFPQYQQDASNAVREHVIKTLVERGKATREVFTHPRSILIRYPLIAN